MPAKQPDDLDDEEVKHFGMVKPEDQTAMISYHRAIAADPRVPKADRELAKQRADAYCYATDDPTHDKDSPDLGTVAYSNRPDEIRADQLTAEWGFRWRNAKPKR